MTEESKSNATASNVDPLEIAKFEALAHRWWDTSSEFKPLHEINPLRANFIDRLSPVAEKKVIDIGCGGGILSEALTQRGAQVTGIDMGDAPLGVAELHALENNLTIEYKKITAEEIAAERPGQYDVVTCLEMLEHVPDPAANPKSYLFAILGAEHILGLLPKGTHDYEKLIKPSELYGWIRESHLILNDSTGMTYNPLSKKYKLHPTNLDVNYLLHATKPA